jgi:hypothetical protein
MASEHCPGCCIEGEWRYPEWLVLADKAIERGLNANAIWRLHEVHARRRYAVDANHIELGGES